MEDEELLCSLGANAIDREEFEQDLLKRLEEKFNPEIAADNDGNDNGKQEESCEHDRSTQNTSHENKTETNATSDISQGILKSLLTSSKGKNERKSEGLNNISGNDNEVEAEEDRKVRTGEMTPFGTVIEKTSPKKNSFLDFGKYLQSQKELQQKYGKKGTKKGDYHKTQETTHGDKRKQGTKSTLDMNVLFPKKGRKKESIGTKVSEDPSDARRKPGRSVAEITSMNVDPMEDSDYIPSESDLSEGEYETSRRSKRVRLTINSSKKAKKNDGSSSSSSDDSYYEDACGRLAKNLRKEADDGNINTYKKRVQNWKDNETRFTGEFHTFEGGFKIPMPLWESLYNYQNVGVKWLYELHQQRCGGILCDEMGMGKTIQVISFLAGLACSNLMFRFSKYRGLGPSLIVCPATVMHQWVKEFHTWWPPFRIAILHESGSYSGSKQGLIQSIQEGNGILVTSYVGVVNNQNEILKYPWHYVILDEGHKIRNPDAQVTLTVKQVTTPHRLILSGSPLQNNLKELWSLFDFVYPGKLGQLPDFIEKFSIPITQGGYSNASQIQVAIAFKCATVLRDIINPYMLRRMKSDVKNHINLPEKSEQVLFCKMTEEQRGVYISYVNSKEVDSIVQGRFNLFVGLINLRKICNHPHLFDGGPKIIKSNNSRIPKNRANMNASAGTSANCDNEVLQRQIKEDCDIELDPSNSFGHWSKSGKMIVVETLLKLWHSQKHKVLLFTQSRQMLCIFENFVRHEKYSYLRLDGSTSIGSRQPMIKKFNEDPSIFVFILTTRVGGLGINLTGANRVVLFDPDWNPSTDTQARERAWRIGQEKQVTIYRLITSGTIEEKIYHRQVFKQFLANRVLKDPKQKRFFKSNDMLELFSYNEGTHGTESESIFAGTGSAIAKDRKFLKKYKAKKIQAEERSSGKFKNIPHLVKQKKSKQEDADIVEETENSKTQDDYVLQSLFSKSGVQAALRHDRIVETDEADYMILEQEAERVAKDAILQLKRSREQCYSAAAGQANWTGNSGSVKQPAVPKPRFGSRKSVNKVETKTTEINDEQKYFAGPSVDSKKSDQNALSSSDLLAIIKNRNIVSRVCTIGEGNEEGESSNTQPSASDGSAKSQHLELLRDIREYIAFRAIVDGQATTTELLSEFTAKLPPENSSLFKQMLGQLCTFRRVAGQGIWRLKPEFR